MVDILTVLIIMANFVISVWNAYASGYNIGLIRKNNIEGFQKYAAYSGLGLAFAGVTYVMIVVLSLLAVYTGYIDVSTLNYALSFDSLVFGLLIIAFGLMITIQSIIIAYQRRNIWSILIALWNVFAEIWDIAAYASGFKQASSIVTGGDRNNRTQTAAIVVVALLIAYFITHAAYIQGLNKAMDTNKQIQVQQSNPQPKNERVRRF